MSIEINGNAQNVAGRDQHIHIYYTEGQTSERKQQMTKMRTELLSYRNDRLPEMHNLLCDYVNSHFGRQKIVELNFEELSKLYQYHQKIIYVSQILNQQKQQPTSWNLVNSLMKHCVNLLKRS